MKQRWFVRAVMAAMLLGPLASYATSLQTPACPPDDKLIGRIQLSTVDAPDTIWGIFRAGLAGAGVDVEDDAAMLAVLNGWLGTEFSDLDDAIAAQVDSALPWDANGNGYVCLFSLRGTRANLRDPSYKFYTFGISDDKHSQ